MGAGKKFAGGKKPFRKNAGAFTKNKFDGDAKNHYLKKRQQSHQKFERPNVKNAIVVENPEGFQGRPQQGTFPDKAHGFKRPMKVENSRASKVKRVEEVVELADSSSEVDEEQKAAFGDYMSHIGSFAKNDLDADAVCEDLPQKPVQKKKTKEKTVFELLDERIDEKKSKVHQEESEEEDVVPMVNSANSNRFDPEAHKFDYGDMDDSDDEEDDSEDAEEHAQSEADEAESEVEEESLKQSLKNMSMAEMRKLKEKLGIKLFNKMYFESTPSTANGTSDAEEESSEEEEEPDSAVANKKKSRHAPREMSSKKPVPVGRPLFVDEINHAKRRFDPRFTSQCGEFCEGEFRRDYGFLDELQANDLKKLKTAFKKAKKGTKKANELKTMIRRIENQQRSMEERDMWRETRQELHDQNIERMNKGIKPVFLNNKQLKKKFEDKKIARIEARGGLDKYLRRKEKKESKKKLM